MTPKPRREARPEVLSPAAPSPKPGPAGIRRPKPAATPERRCLVTGIHGAPAEMVRFVVGPDGRVVPDVERTLPGRGLWIAAERDIVARAVARRLFAKAARSPAEAAAELPDLVEALLAERCCGRLGLARRAGWVAVGFEGVRAWLAAGRAGLLLEAADGAEGGVAKMMALAGDLPVSRALRAEELGRALGREAVVHVAVAKGQAAERLAAELRRLSGFRRGPADGPAKD